MPTSYLSSKPLSELPLVRSPGLPELLELLSVHLPGQPQVLAAQVALAVWSAS